jgi:prevent-host-death family protein
MKQNEKTITATEFKAKCLHIFDHLDAGGLVVTKRGQPVARVVPMTSVDNSKLIGSLKDEVKVLGDIFSTGEKWDAESRHPHARGPLHRGSHRSRA